MGQREQETLTSAYSLLEDADEKKIIVKGFRDSLFHI
jgi:hypothetical protein